ncbi:hypothetical protein, partial [Okeania hirsuta]|uniref:hypothetical protein n=1 Tax=Okeania hirsuta TaxID=1458930 RepID=UPI001374C442
MLCTQSDRSMKAIIDVLLIYCPIVIALHTKRSLCFVIIDVLSIYWTIVIGLHTKRSLCFVIIDVLSIY